MLPFHISNLEASNREQNDALIRIDAPDYDATISTNPAATLKYLDEDEGDLITLGSSRELIEKLEEPVPHSGGKSHSPTQIEMPIVFRSAKSHQQRLEHHVFEILPREDIQKLWQDIQAKSKKIKPTSNLAEHKFPGQNSLDEEKETKLASVYERRRREIWSMIAAEVGISWRLAESLHWALGEQEMARRAKKAAGDDQVRTSETDVGLPLQNPGVRNLEDYRGHYFDTTRPPRLDVSVPQTPPTIDSRLVDSTFANTILGKAAYLTAEGRRQAQAAGLKLRARTIWPRHSSSAISATDHTSQQNRWACYKSPTSAFLPGVSIGVPQGFDESGLTLEDRRQTQVAGDKLRCRNNNRYPTPSRRVSTEHGINKNRWSSYGDNRMTRFDEHQDGHAGSKENPQSQNVQHDNIDRQSSLLEIFEAELAKKSGPAAGGSGLSITTGVSRTKVFHESSAVFRAKGWHELSAVFLQDADSAHRTHLQYIGDALLGFRNVTGDFLNLGKGLIAGDAHEKAQSFQRSSNVMKISDNPRTTSLDIQTTDVSRTSILPVDARPKKEDFELGQQSSPRNKSDIAVLQGPNMDCHSEVSTESGYRATKFMPRIVPGRFRYVYSDCLQGPRSAKTFEEESDRGYASSTPIVTRFPTLSRFENQSLSQNAVPASSFPPLPSMELLVPARTTSPLVEHDGTRKSRDNLLSSSGASDVFKANYSRTTELSEHLLPRPDGNFLASTSHNSAVTSRLAKAFDALEAESAARHYLTEEIRRNATSECSGRKQTETRRRPHSEAVGRTGRLAVFPDAGQRPLTTESEALNCLNANKENFKGRAHAGSTPQGSIPADASYFDQHHDDCTVSKIHDCVEQLIDMGFGGNSANGERLLVYAQAADGELIEAIDVIDEEQRAYRSRGLS